MSQRETALGRPSLEQMRKTIHRTFTLILLLSTLSAACAPSARYWIPPRSVEPIRLEATLEPNQVFFRPEATLSATTNPGSTDSIPAPTPTPEKAATIPIPVPGILDTHNNPILYYAQPADTLPVVAVRFGVDPSEIQSTQPIPETAYLTPGQLLLIPSRLSKTTSAQRLIPDSEIVFSPSATDFDIASFVKEAGGRLDIEQEWLKSSGLIDGAEVIQKVSMDNSINPRLLLALLEYQGGWVFGFPDTQDRLEYPLGYRSRSMKGLFNQLMWAIEQLSKGYYAYREGRMTEIRFQDGSTARLAPDLNAGSVALQYFFAQLYQEDEWSKALDPEVGFPAFYTEKFGDPWQRAQKVEPLFPPGIEQPPLILPFERNKTWSFTGGPHGAWDAEGPYAALDFAPGSIRPGCEKSNAWTLAAASGLVIRSGNGVVTLDLDGDGRQETGWVLVYTHVASEGATPVGTWVDTGDLLGNPSCEGGFATGTHVHIARKYNGEWIPAYGPLPFNLGGWIADYGGKAYRGTLVRDGDVVKACTCSNFETFITRRENDP